MSGVRAVALCLATLAVAGDAAIAAPLKPHIVFILADGGSYKRPSTPSQPLLIRFFAN